MQKVTATETLKNKSTKIFPVVSEQYNPKAAHSDVRPFPSDGMY